MKQQIKDLFTFPQETFEKGLYFSGYKGESEFKEWWGNGQLWTHCFYKDNKLDGEYRYWNDKGKLEVHQLYKNDRIVKDYLK